jgi:3-methyl-2-oxobutanoate hydroxymethyltransferase
MAKQPKQVRIPEILEKKRRGEKIAVLTAYDATMARLIDRAGVDILLVGDSLGSVIMGRPTTLEVTMDIMVHHTRAVAEGARQALIVADLPFLSYQASIADAVRNAGRLLSEGQAHAVKLEGGRSMQDTVARLVEIGIPVMGHIGMTPQSVNRFGGHRRRPATETGAMIADAKAIEQAGAFSIVIESVPPESAKAVTDAVAIPTIGIGAGPHCDGQVLVSYDAFGLFDDAPSFVKRYADLASIITQAAREFAEEVRTGRFPK